MSTAAKVLLAILVYIFVCTLIYSAVKFGMIDYVSKEVDSHAHSNAVHE